MHAELNHSADTGRNSSRAPGQNGNGSRVIEAMSAQIIVPERFRLAVERGLHARVESAARASSIMLHPMALRVMAQHFAQAHFAADRCDIVEVNRLLDAAKMCIALQPSNTSRTG